MVEKIYLKIITIGSAITLLTPLLVTHQTLFPHSFNKAMVFQSIIQILLFIYILLVIKNKAYRPRLSPIMIATTFFIGTLILTSITGSDLARSFFGTGQRSTGVFSMLHFYFFFVILASVFRTWDAWKPLLRTTIVVSFITFIWQVIKFKFNIPAILSTNLFYSTLGNTAYYSTYLLLHVFITIFLLFKDDNKRWKIFYYCVLASNLLGLFLTSSRGATLSLFFGGFILISYFILTSKNKKLKILSISGTIFILFLSIFLFLSRNSSWMWNYTSLRPLRALTAYSLEEQSIKARLMAWESGLKGWLDKPLLGWGPENYNLAYDKYFNPEFREAGLTAIWYDKSHNSLLDSLVTSGVLGLLAYFSIWVSILVVLWRSNHINRKLKIALFALFAAHFTQNLFFFDTVNSYILVFLLLAFVHSLNYPEKDIPLAPQKEQSYIPAAALSILLIFSISVFQIKPAIASFYTAQSVFAFRDNAFKIGESLFKKALDLSTFLNPEIRIMGAQAAIRALQTKDKQNTINKDLFTFYDFEIEEMKKNIEKHPLDDQYYYWLGQLYNFGAEYNPIYLTLAEEPLEKAILLSPTRQQLYFELSRTKLTLAANNEDENKYLEAIELLKKAVLINKNVGSAHWKLGLAYIMHDDLENGLRATDKALEKGVDWGFDNETISFVAQAYKKALRYDKAIELYAKITGENPDLDDPIVVDALLELHDLEILLKEK